MKQHQTTMTKDNKRRHNTSGLISSPLIMNTKKKDTKPTPNKTNGEKNDEEKEELQSLGPVFQNTTDRQLDIDNKDTGKETLWGHALHGSDNWCAAKHQCLNKSVRATSRKRCTKCGGCTHSECFGKIKKHFCLTCDESNIKTATKTDKNCFGTTMWCAAQEQCTNKTFQANSKYICYQCNSNVHLECVHQLFSSNNNQTYCNWCAELLELENEYGDNRNKTTETINNSLYSTCSMNNSSNNINTPTKHRNEEENENSNTFNKSSTPLVANNTRYNDDSNNGTPYYDVKDTHIPKSVFTAFNESIISEEEIVQLPVFGTKQWCASQDKCQNKNHEAPKELWCTVCKLPTHINCTVLSNNRSESICLFCAEIMVSGNKECNETKKIDDIEIRSTTTKDDEVEILFTTSNENQAQQLIEPFQNDASYISIERSIEDEYNALQNENLPTAIADTTMDSTSPTETKECENIYDLKILLEKVQGNYNLNLEKRDASVQAIAIISNTTIANEYLDEHKLRRYVEINQEWFRRTENVLSYMSNSKFKLLEKIMNDEIKSKKQVKKNQLPKLRQELMERFTSTQIKDVKQFKVLHCLAKITGIFFENSTFLPKEKKRVMELSLETLRNCNQTVPVQDKFSVNFLLAHIQEQEQEQAKDKKSIKEQTNGSSVTKISRVLDIVSNETQTTTQPTTHAARTNTRLELRLNIRNNESDTNTLLQLQTQLQELLDKLLEIDNSLTVLPWFDRTEQVPLLNNKVPNNLRSINQYFQRLQPKLTGNSYGEFQIQHSRRWEDIAHDMTPWLTENKHGLYYQTLQCPTTTNLGWLLWSFRRIDTSILQREIKDRFGLKINLRYQNISEGKGQSLQENIVRALHVVVDQKEADQASVLLQRIYSFQESMFPLGIVMRFIPHVQRVKSDKLPKIIKLRNRQKSFLQAIENSTKQMSATSWEILQLDTNIKEFGTLRKNLMSIMSKQKPTEPLFLSVDTSFFRSNEVLFTFLPRHENEARMFVANIVPFFLHNYNLDILKDIFQREALIRASQTTWNAELQEVASPSDLYLEQSGDIQDNFDILEVLGIDLVSNNNTKGSEENEEQRVERLFTGEDSTSIGTLFTNNQKNDNVTQQYSANHSSNMSNNNRSVSTSLTSEEVEKKMGEFSQELSEIKNLMHQLLQKQPHEGLNSTAENHNNMEVDTNQLKRSAGDSWNESTCNNK
jgi:hypothetical protein